jgi:hypothetical protein
MKVPIPATITLVLIISLISMVIAGQHSQDIIFEKAQEHFKKNYFNQQVSNLRLDVLDKIEEYETKNYAGDQVVKRELTYRVTLLIQKNSEVHKLNECRLNNSPQCGWMGLTCQPNLYGPDLKELTRQGDQVLIYTYDQGRSNNCIQK